MKIILALLLLCGPALASVLHVPADYPNIQRALDAAQPYDTVLVQQGVYYEHLVISKPVTLMGSPSATVFNDWAGPDQPPTALLAGPGTGTVTIAHMVFRGLGEMSFTFSVAPAIAGSGFTKLRILNSDIRGVDVVGEIFQGTDAIFVHVPLVIVERSHVEGGLSYPSDIPTMPNPNGSTAIAAPTVVLVNSTVKGGTFSSGSWLFVPCEQTEGGVGGTGIKAAAVFLQNSEVSGGEGLYLADPLDPSIVCEKPDGVPIVADTIVDGGAPWTGGTQP